MRPEELDDVYARIVLQKRGELLLRELAELKRRGRKDSIHDTRVQSRRMRAALEAFQDLFPPRNWEPLYTSVRQITRHLGRVRETEVLLSLLDDLSADFDVPQMLCLEYLGLRLTREHARLRTRLRKRLAKTDMRTLRSKVKALLAGRGDADEFDAGGDNVIALRPVRGSRLRLAARVRQPSLFALHGESIDRARRVLREIAGPLLAFRPRRDFRRATDARLHRLRIQAKKLRYAMEIFDEVWSGGLEGPLELARAFQEAGGHFQDWAVMRRRLLKESRRLTRRDAHRLAHQMERITLKADSRKSILRNALLPVVTRLQAALRDLLERPGSEVAPREAVSDATGAHPGV